LKKYNIRAEWKEIVRMMNTQKIVTTCVENDKNQMIRIRKCSEPTEKIKRIYDALEYKYAPFVRKKSVVNKNESLKMIGVDVLNFSSG
jgi:predicted Rossmann-fold nucleotide-binding protein